MSVLSSMDSYFMAPDESYFAKNGFACSDYGETKGTEGKNYNLNYVRQLRGGYNNFYGDNIFILKRN